MTPTAAAATGRPPVVPVVTLPPQALPVLPLFQATVFDVTTVFSFVGSHHRKESPERRGALEAQ